MKKLILCAALLLAAGCGSTGTTGRSVARLELAKAEMAPPWSEVKSIDKLPCRLLEGGGKGTLTLPVWWGRSLRPARGMNYLALIKYKDSVLTPIRVNLHSGLPRESEIHRIGGHGDNQWKTAAVPVPWDMIMRLKDKDETAVYLITPKGTNLPVQSIRIVRGNAEKDEKLWAAETRDWVARVQKEKRQKAVHDKPRKPVVPAEFSDAAAITYPRPIARLVQQNSTPQKDEAGATLKITMAENEIGCAQIGVYAHGSQLENVELRCSQLKTVAGTPLSGDIALFTAEYSAVTNKDGKYPLFPQRLWSSYPVSIRKGMSHLFWINIDCADKPAAAGLYRGRITVNAGGTSVSAIPIEVMVYPFRLLTMKEAGLHMGGCTTKLIPAHELELLVKHNHNSINLWYSGFPIPLKRKADGGFDMDFLIANDFMKYATEAGIENFVYFLGGNPYGYPDTMHLERDCYRFVYSDNPEIDDSRAEWIKKTWATGGKVAKEIRPIYSEWTKRFYENARTNNWPKPILTPFDEPAKWTQANWAKGKAFRWKRADGRYSFRTVKDRDEKAFREKMKDFKLEELSGGGAGPWIKSHFKDACDIIHKASPDAKIYGSIHHAEPGIVFLEDIDVFCTNAIGEDKKLGDKVRAGKKTFWQYSGTNDHRSPAEARYTFGFYFASFNSRGSLIWAYNWGSRFDTATRGNQWLYAWTTPYSLVRTPYFEGLRKAWDDRRYIETLKKIAAEKGKQEEATALLEKIYNKVVKSRTEGGRDTVHDFFARTNNPEQLEVYRNQIAEMIIKLQR